ncbi:MAG TPA: diphosphomevalonate decarboxylase [Anaerolineales bacterium]|nr:diphosphomevalonate decarboxylase [Anaerolineales bacterium]
MSTATAQAHPNIAFIKYWGNRDSALRIPANGSISMNLEGLFTRTTVSFQPSLPFDELIINGHEVTGAALERVSAILDIIRSMANLSDRAEVITENNFPSSAGIASSASAFAALALAGSKAAGLDLSERDLSRLARRGSGSASRSIPGGFVEWQAGSGDEDSFAFSIAPPDHWELVDCIAVVSASRKKTGSTEGHLLAPTSPLQAARVADAPRRLEICRRAILERDFESLAHIVELDSDMMHAVMMTSTPALHYWKPASLEIMEAVRTWRAEGIHACYTVDAGPNVHVICLAHDAQRVEQRLREIEGVTNVLIARAGGAARIVENGEQVGSKRRR